MTERQRIAKYTEIIHRHGEWMKADEQIRPGDFHVFLDEAGEASMVNFKCPCGCGSDCPTRVVPAGKPHHNRQWEYKAGGHLIHPSVHWTSGCLAHFFINLDGTVAWC